MVVIVLTDKSEFESIVVPLPPPLALIVSPEIVMLSPAINVFCLEVCIPDMSVVLVSTCACIAVVSVVPPPPLVETLSTLTFNSFISVIKMSYYIISIIYFYVSIYANTKTIRISFR